MILEDKKIILSFEEDYEICRLIHHIIELKFGSIKVVVRQSRPYQLFDLEKSILISKKFAKDIEINKSKDSDTYGG